MNDWHWKDYLIARRKFVQTRQYRVSTIGVGLVFTATWLAGWFTSVLLLHWGHVTGMPLRYALSAIVAYAVFFTAVRVWANFQREDPWTRPSLDNLLFSEYSVVDGKSFLAAFAVFVVSLICAVLLSIFGGFAALLEVAFEVAFAGVVVRRAFGPNIVVGRWWLALLRRTALPALLITVLLVILAAQVQARYPQSNTLGQAMSQWQSKRHGAQ